VNAQEIAASAKMQFTVTNRQILKLAAPISLSLLIPQISFMANAVFLGQLGQRELVVNGLCSIFYLLLTYIGFGLSNGIMVLLSRRAGEGDKAGLGRTFANGLFLCAISSLCLMMLSFWFSPLLFGYSLKDENIFYTTIDFLYLRIWGLPFLMLTQLINAFYISTNRSRLLIYGALLANIVNVVMDYFLIFGNGGFPFMGLKGAAVASIMGEVVCCLVMYSLFFLKKLHFQYPVFRYLVFDSKMSVQTLKVAAPLILQYVFSIGGWQIFYIYVEHMGVTELAASHILRSVLGIVSIGTWALASTCNTMVSNVIGQGATHQILPLVRKIMVISLAYTSLISAFLFFFPTTFLGAYTSDLNVVNIGLSSLRVLALSSLVMSMATICFNAVIGTGNTLINLAIEVFCVCMYILYITIVIEKLHQPLHIAWASEFVYWTCLLLTSGGYLLWGGWRGKKL
jgi:MATE family multidrug resistance protein